MEKLDNLDKKILNIVMGNARIRAPLFISAYSD